MPVAEPETFTEEIEDIVPEEEGQETSWDERETEPTPPTNEWTEDEIRAAAAETFADWFGTDEANLVSFEGTLGPAHLEGLTQELYVDGRPLSTQLDAVGQAYYREVFMPALLTHGRAAWAGSSEGGEVQDGSIAELHGTEVHITHATRLREDREWDDDDLFVPLADEVPAHGEGEPSAAAAAKETEVNLDAWAAAEAPESERGARESWLEEEPTADSTVGRQAEAPTAAAVERAAAPHAQEGKTLAEVPPAWAVSESLEAGRTLPAPPKTAGQSAQAHQDTAPPTESVTKRLPELPRSEPEFHHITYDDQIGASGRQEVRHAAEGSGERGASLTEVGQRQEDSTLPAAHGTGRKPEATGGPERPEGHPHRGDAGIRPTFHGDQSGERTLHHHASGAAVPDPRKETSDVAAGRGRSLEMATAGTAADEKRPTASIQVERSLPPAGEHAVHEGRQQEHREADETQAEIASLAPVSRGWFAQTRAEPGTRPDAAGERTVPSPVGSAEEEPPQNAVRRDDRAVRAPSERETTPEESLQRPAAEQPAARGERAAARPAPRATAPPFSAASAGGNILTTLAPRATAQG